MRPSSLTKNEEIFPSIGHKGYKLCHNQSGVDYLHRLFHQQVYLLNQITSKVIRNETCRDPYCQLQQTVF